MTPEKRKRYRDLRLNADFVKQELRLAIEESRAAANRDKWDWEESYDTL
jgi:hypothetical protein